MYKSLTGRKALKEKLIISSVHMPQESWCYCSTGVRYQKHFKWYDKNTGDKRKVKCKQERPEAWLAVSLF